MIERSRRRRLHVWLADKATAKKEQGLSATEVELLASYQRLPPKYQRRLREQAREFETLAKTRTRTR